METIHQIPEELKMKTSRLIPLISTVVTLLIGFTSPSFSQLPEKLFQQGLVKEEGEGELQEAIELYNQVVDDESADRALRAKALLHVGICYEKLGQEEAKKTYEKLIVDFADQGEIVAIGKEKLAILNVGNKTTKSEDLIITQVWSPAKDTYGVSPDGRYLSYIDWRAIELAVKDLKTGKTWNITNRGTWKPPAQWPDNSVWSPDSKQLAYYWITSDSTELRIANIDGSADRLLRNGLRYFAPWPVAWSPDERYILAMAELEDDSQPDKMAHIVLVSVDDGSIRIIKSLEEHQMEYCGDFSPDSKYFIYPLHLEEGTHYNEFYLFATDGSSEKLILKDPADNRDPLWMPDGNGIVFISDRMGTDDLWTLKIHDGVPEGKPELLMSNLGKETKLLGITDDGSLYYMNQHMRSDVYIASLDFSTGKLLSEPDKISNIEEERNIKPIWSPDGRNLLYLTSSYDLHGMIGHKQNLIIYDSENQKTRKLDTDLYIPVPYYWRQPQWSPDGNSLLIHARTNEDRLQGFFTVNINTGDRTSILVKKRGIREYTEPVGYFPVFTRDGKNILYLTQDRKAIISRNIDTKQERKIYSAEDQILQYRLSPDGTQIVFGHFFKDRNVLYTLSADGGEKRSLLKTEEKTTPYIIGWTPDNKHLIFETGAYGSQDPHEIFRVPVSGGDPERVLLLDDLFSQGYIENIEVHPDGQHVVIDAWTGQDTEVWTIENLFKK